MPGRLKRENAVRNPVAPRPAAALMIGLALVSFVAVFAAGLRGSIDDAIDKTLAGDLIVSNTDGFSDIPDATVDVVAGVDGVEVASPIRYTQDDVEGAGEGFPTLVDPATAAEVLTLDWREGSQELLTELTPEQAVIDEGGAPTTGSGSATPSTPRPPPARRSPTRSPGPSRTRPTSSATTRPRTPTRARTARART